MTRLGLWSLIRYSSNSTYLGRRGDDYGNGIAVDGAGNAYVTGVTSSTNFPITNPLQASNGGGDGDAFVTKINAAGSAKVYLPRIPAHHQALRPHQQQDHAG